MEINDYTIYDSLTGRIQKSTRCQALVIDNLITASQSYIVGERISSSGTKYVDTLVSAVIDRPISPIAIDKTTLLADTIDKVTLTNVEVGSEIFINGVGQGIENSGTTEITFDTVGTHYVSVVIFPWLNYRVNINAT